MEIKEIVSYFLNTSSNILEVSFRTLNDEDDVLRVDSIDYTVAEDYGYILESESFDFLDDEFEDDLFEKEKIELDKDELISFLNEYYEMNPKSLPKSDFY